MASAARAASATTLRGRGTAAHQSRAADRHATHWGAIVWMMRERRVLHALAHFKALRRLAFSLGDGFVNVSRHGGEGVEFHVPSFKSGARRPLMKTRKKFSADLRGLCG